MQWQGAVNGFKERIERIEMSHKGPIPFNPFQKSVESVLINKSSTHLKHTHIRYISLPPVVDKQFHVLCMLSDSHGRNVNNYERPSTMAISSSVKPYNSYTSASICRSVASIWRW